jgi:hypothetical protein
MLELFAEVSIIVLVALMEEVVVPSGEKVLVSSVAVDLVYVVNLSVKVVISGLMVMSLMLVVTVVASNIVVLFVSSVFKLVIFN